MQGRWKVEERKVGSSAWFRVRRRRTHERHHRNKPAGGVKNTASIAQHTSSVTSKGGPQRGSPFACARRARQAGVVGVRVGVSNHHVTIPSLCFLAHPRTTS